MTTYDSIGKNYNTTRRADERIRSRLVKHLNCTAHSRIADIGAGTGKNSYELAACGYSVCALEPSGLMVRQGISIFSVTTPEETKEKINRLRVDLSNGTWDRKYGFYRERVKFGGGYYFLSVRK